MRWRQPSVYDRLSHCRTQYVQAVGCYAQFGVFERCSMGVTKRICCIQCGYKSDELDLGSGMLEPGPKEILSCAGCNTLFAGVAAVRRERWLLPGPGLGDCHCPRCDTEGSPAQTESPRYMRRLFGLIRARAESVCYQCPACGSFETQDTIIGLWD